MNRAMSLLAVTALMLGVAASAWADHIPADIGVCNTHPDCTLTGVSGTRALWDIHTDPAEDHSQELVQDQQDPTQYIYQFAGTANESLWSFEGNAANWDRFPLPWGNKVVSAQKIIQTPGDGVNVLLMSTGDHGPPVSEMIWEFVVNHPATHSVTGVDVEIGSATWLDMQARATSSDSFVGFAGFPGTHTPATGNIGNLSLLDTSTPGQTRFQVKVIANNNPGRFESYFRATATVVPEPASLAIILAGLYPLVRRRR